MSEKIGVVLSMQCDYGNGIPESHQAYWATSLYAGSPLIGRHCQQRWPGSFDGANVLICGALNFLEAYEAGKPPPEGRNVTHIVLMHNDVVPEVGWLDLLMNEMIDSGADFLSVAMPIKDMDGKSSCAIDDDPWQVMRRIMMQEIYDLPPTFCAEDCGYPPGSLLVNTGLCVFDFTKPWWRETNDDGTLKLHFTSPDRIKRRPPREGETVGTWEAQHSPSDWHISRELNKRGAKVMATRAVKCQHVGQLMWSNEQPWGNHKVDPALTHKFGGVPIANVAWCEAKPFCLVQGTNGVLVYSRSTWKPDGPEMDSDALYQRVRNFPNEIDTRKTLTMKELNDARAKAEAAGSAASAAGVDEQVVAAA